MASLKEFEQLSRENQRVVRVKQAEYVLSLIKAAAPEGGNG